MPVANQEDQPVMEEGLSAELLEEAPGEVTYQTLESSGVERREVERSEQGAGYNLSGEEQQGRPHNGLGRRPKHEVSYAQARG